MPKDWYKNYEDRAEDREEARRNQVTASSTPESVPPKAAGKPCATVDTGSGGAVRHKGF
ncbi:hypothetical protein LCGC14_2585480 [marine sediment metagenome]|uniref:Uncharacterized protein n=1 Tax=marine sediment metagenome TaxID=412755 RepID=A0A0F9B144_9ZZZZ